MKTKNHGILKTLIKIQFHHKILNLTNINPLTNWQVFISEPKSSIPQNHILLLDQDTDHNDSVMIFQDWSCKENNFHARILHDPIHKEDNKM